MTKAYAYNANRFKTLNNENMNNFNTLFYIINYNVSFIDRTSNIKIPIKTAVPPNLVMPKFDPNFSMTYEECCQSRVREILSKQKILGVPIRLFYSGGIDSSLILASFIKEIGLEESENKIQIVMNADSIEENPFMYEKIIRKGNFTIINSEDHSNDWTKERILVGGEFNDQLLGSDCYNDLTMWKGDGILNKLWSESLMVEYFLQKNLSLKHCEMWAQIFSDHLRKAPCSIETVADWWWWINFSCKWNSVYFRILMYVRNEEILSENYLNDYYCQFYGNDDFQKWSMVDRTSKHQGTWLSYKWLAKKLICDFLGNDQYMQKIKRGSLWHILSYKKSAEIIDENYQYDWKCNASDWYEPNNNFGNI